MKIIHCDHCQNLVFFENVKCLNCGHLLGFIPQIQQMVSLEPSADGFYTTPNPDAGNARYRLCSNYQNQDICNWIVPADDPNPYCESCRLTGLIPDLSVPGNKEAWYRIEVAKRRLLYSILILGLPLQAAAGSGKTLSFKLMADVDKTTPVLTGHDNGLITLNIAEADDIERERRRTQMHEPYRTLIGHFRHEIGHYYWDILVANSPFLTQYRNLFGDERQDYGEALKIHYTVGAPGDWQDRFISTYASCHPWEDWAESWAHYLHITDSWETAMACGLTLKPRRSDEPTIGVYGFNQPFSRRVESWCAVAYLLNNINRGLGLPDGYPFVMSSLVIEKLRFIDTVVQACSTKNETAKV